jgi:hypothetical protein
MRADRAKTLASLVTIAAALLLLYLSLHIAPPQFDPRPHEALGGALAEETAKLLTGGGHLTLIMRDTASVQNPATDAQLRGFLQRLKPARLAINATNLIKLDPLRLPRVPPGEFLQIIGKHSEGDVIVSLLGPPLLNPDQMVKLAEKGPRILALCSGNLPRQVNLKELFDQHALYLAIIDRPVPGPEPAPSSPGRAWFERYFQIITSANLNELPPYPIAGAK